ncbi:FAD-dependent oxidoreductase [Agathobacter ruminis]|uniref:Pyridine nucleotide-disulfide oxidoreductase n=1 Tax=Agathobacter ruminis TaxID=1712665 RepID=A0A2G3DZF8_9FIRM|nr:FAD-dependent oxidoreductase [Agathobacter ruminis]MDC7300692.1 FAD-dependent oxidoreductase [Agathobacter ruminis]PHU36418.1 pyridine nucleotide-disulfide oxidoreductase [Agathobacter ruminis]
MADPLGGYVPDTVKNDEPARDAIIRLGKVVTDRAEILLGKEKITKESPEYWGIAPLITDEQAEIAIKMKKRKPRTLEDMKKLTGLDEAYLLEQLDKMSEVGIIEYNWENEKHEKQWILPMYVPGAAEFANMNADVLAAHPEEGRFFERMSRLPLEKITPMVPLGGAGIGMHVIPVEKAIEMENESVSVEHISHWLDKYDGKYAASPCSCRQSRKTFDEGCADDPEGWCIAVGDMADYVVETNKGGRYITREEALAIMKQAEDNGFVHQITNIDGENKIFAICNCNVNVCYALRTSQLFNTPNMSRSAYVAHVNTENCVACGRCVEYCPAGAVTLGQKLCKKDGSQVKYPKMPLPAEKKWGPEMWTEDYRDKNRINTHETGTAPCKTACPAHIAVQGYIKMASQGRYQDALALIKKNNPLPAICGYVCNRRCEDACTRGTIDEAVSIDEIKKFIAMQDLNADTRYIPKKVVPSLKGEFTEKIAVIGAGPAGLSCAFYLAEKGYKPTVFEKNAQPGGMVVYGIPSFVLEKDIVQAEIDVLKEMGVEFKCGVEVGKDITIAQLREQGYKAFYIGIGCQGGRKVGVPGEDANGVMTGVEFLHITTENEDYKLNGDTVVIGGGNVAIDVSRSAIRCGSPKVHQVSLETRDIMPASPDEIEIAESEDILIQGGWGPKEILTENGNVTGIVFKKCTSVKDADGRFNPQYDENDTMTIPCSNILLSVGQAIEWGGLLDGEDVEFWHGNYPVADKVTYQTRVPDIFVGGDVYSGPKFAIDAIAAGKEGAISIHRFVQPHSSLTIGRDPHYYVELDKEDILVENYDNSKRQRPATKPGVGKDSFRSAACTLTEEQIQIETKRCLGCGATIVDENQCVGCGICTTKCEFDAIHLERDLPRASVMRKSEDKLKYVLGNGLKQKLARPFVRKTK